MTKKEATNTFLDGLLMDLNPITTPSNVMTHCLNGTLLTYNGNEHVLLNDMGNGRVESAQLPKGYIPLGTAELGGIIYIASYNPLTGKSLIGSFPSPERNFSSSEAGKHNAVLNCSNFFEKDSDGRVTKAVITDTIKLELTDTYLRAGDKFHVGSKEVKTEQEILSAYGSEDEPNSKYDPNAFPRQLKLHLVSVLEDGKMVYLDDHLTWYNETNPYYIDSNTDKDGNLINVDEYLDTVNANYSVFYPEVPGKLAIVALLEAIENFSASVSIGQGDVWEEKDENGDVIGGDNTGENVLYLHFNTNWTYTNANYSECGKINPKLLLVKFDKDTVDDGIIEIGSTDGRKNDGTDSEVKNSPLAYRLDLTKGYLSDEIMTFTLYPYMEYGYLKYLGIPFKIDLSSLGTGETKLNEYRYYVEDEFMTLSYGFDSYPKAGTTVDTVTFEFFNLDEDIYKKINGENSPVENTEYIEEDKEIINNDDLKKGYSFTYKSDSLLGHFSKKIYWDNTEVNGLKKDLCYIVRITVNYGSEKRYFYRILYTNSIFNSAYYDYNDFSLCELNKYLTVNFSSSTTTTNPSLTRTYWIKEVVKIDGKETIEETEVSSIPVMQEDTTNTITSDYIIKDVFNDTSTTIITSETSANSLFKSSLSSNGNLVHPVEFKENSNAEVTCITTTTNLSTSLDKSNECTISDDDGKVIIVGTNTHTLKTPILVEYGATNYMSAQYLFTNLEKDIYYLNTTESELNTDGTVDTSQERFITLGLDTGNFDPLFASYNYKVVSKDEDRSAEYQSITTIPKIGTAINSLLEEKDCLILVFTTYNMKKTSNFNLEIKKNDGVVSSCPDIEKITEGDYDYCFILLAIRRGTEYIITAPPCDTWGAVEKPSFSKTDNSYTGMPAAVCTKNTTINNIILDPLSNYYKLTDYEGNGIEVKTVSNIVYWNNYTTNIETIYTPALNLKIYVNGINITGSNIKNLYFSGATSYNASYNILRYINLSTIINDLLNTLLKASNKVYSPDSEEFFEVSDLSKSSLYTINKWGDETLHVKKASLLGYIPIKISNNYAEVSSLSGLSTVYLYNRLENLAFKIKKIYKKNS